MNQMDFKRQAPLRKKGMKCRPQIRGFNRSLHLESQWELRPLFFDQLPQCRRPGLWPQAGDCLLGKVSHLGYWRYGEHVLFDRNIIQKKEKSVKLPKYKKPQSPSMIWPFRPLSHPWDPHRLQHQPGWNPFSSSHIPSSLLPRAFIQLFSAPRTVSPRAATICSKQYRSKYELLLLW